ncbi:hypothetical protein N657DRAFT_247827 [Parathielavia appendiculata]|uniref:Uncharacterized protein n=1 Tax=Parathielavia appendiculata TaxID=2587402 RepID=A0AAN6Z0Q1_9PEZI|nr:hypothetical protein N657DRAFT_247827 [Parathielavia appendiculata]
MALKYCFTAPLAKPSSSAVLHPARRSARARFLQYVWMCRNRYEANEGKKWSVVAECHEDVNFLVVPDVDCVLCSQLSDFPDSLQGVYHHPHVAALGLWSTIALRIARAALLV